MTGVRPTTMNSRTQKIAKANGDKFYHGAPCRYGHGTTRYTSSGGCVGCGRGRSKEKTVEMILVPKQTIDNLVEAWCDGLDLSDHMAELSMIVKGGEK